MDFKTSNMMRHYIVLIFVVLFLCSFKNDKMAYILFNSEGKEIQYSKLLEKVKDADVILFGELHDNPIVHWLEQELTKDLYADKKENLILGAEMFESDNQIIIDEYLSDLISEKTLNDEARVWTNYPSDYKPLLDFAKKNKLKFVASNIPRRYASMVYSKGFEILDSIHPEAKKWIAPLPFNMIAP